MDTINTACKSILLNAIVTINFENIELSSKLCCNNDNVFDAMLYPMKRKTIPNGNNIIEFFNFCKYIAFKLTIRTTFLFERFNVATILKRKIINSTEINKFAY